METVRVRINRNLWWMVPLAFGEGVFMAIAPFGVLRDAPKPSIGAMVFLFLLCWSMAGFFLYSVVWMTRSLLFEEVFVDEAGLRWRGAFGPWKQTRWDEISDFYLKNLNREPIILTPQGKFVLSSALSNRASVMAQIAERAFNAPARAWEIERFRGPNSTPQRFDYWTKTQKWTAPIFTAGQLFAVVVVGWNLVFNTKPNTFTFTEQPWLLNTLLALFVLGIFVSLAALFVFVVRTMWRERNFAFQHRDEHLEISPRGLAWQCGESRIESDWDEVRAITFVPGRGLTTHYLVETQNGDFPVWKSLERLSLWLELARQFAPDIAPPIQTTNVEIGGERATWSGNSIGQGARIFHFRTSETRAMLWIPTFFTPILSGAYFLNRSLQTPDDGPLQAVPLVVWLVIALAFFVTCALWFVFNRAAIWVDERGLERRFPFWKTRGATWNEIEAFGHDENGVWIQSHTQKTHLWNSVAPVRKDELLRIVAERATNAQGTWD